MINRIEKNILSSADYVERGQEHVKMALENQKKARKVSLVSCPSRGLSRVTFHDPPSLTEKSHDCHLCFCHCAHLGGHHWHHHNHWIIYHMSLVRYGGHAPSLALAFLPPVRPISLSFPCRHWEKQRPSVCGGRTGFQLNPLSRWPCAEGIWFLWGWQLLIPGVLPFTPQSLGESLQCPVCLGHMVL